MGFKLYCCKRRSKLYDGQNTHICQTKVNYVYIHFVVRVQAGNKNFDFKMKHQSTMGSCCFAHQSNYNSWMSPTLYISERTHSNSPSLFSYLPCLTEWYPQPKSPCLVRFPRRWSASDVNDSIRKREKVNSRSQTIRRGPITPSPRLLLATLSSSPQPNGP